jgi:hypothetical protein
MDQKAAGKTHPENSIQDDGRQIGQVGPGAAEERPATDREDSRPAFTRDERGNIKTFTF